MSKAALLLAAFLGLSAPLCAWGALGHRMVAGAALEDLPPGPAAWFHGLEAAVRDHANDPDGWKRRDPREHPRHSLHCEPYGGPDGVPCAEADAVARLGPERFRACGQVPWMVLERVRLLTGAFAAGDPARAAYAAAILSHYVGDLNVPMHTTVNHDGHLTGQRGVHHRWEIGLLDRLAQDGWKPGTGPVDLGADPWTQPWAWLRDSFSLVPALLADDLEAGQGQRPPGPCGEAYWRAFLRLQGPAVAGQLTRAARRTARMILLAWTEAGCPAAPVMQGMPGCGWDGGSQGFAEALAEGRGEISQPL
jgi:hypothetical protein